MQLMMLLSIESLSLFQPKAGTTKYIVIALLATSFAAVLRISQASRDAIKLVLFELHALKAGCRDCFLFVLNVVPLAIASYF